MRTTAVGLFLAKTEDESDTMNEDFFVVLNTVASMIVIICSVLSISNCLLRVSKRMYKGLKTCDAMWKRFIIMINLLYIAWNYQGGWLNRKPLFSKDFTLYWGFHVFVTLILFFVFAITTVNIHRGDNRIIWVRYIRRRNAGTCSRSWKAR